MPPSHGPRLLLPLVVDPPTVRTTARDTRGVRRPRRLIHAAFVALPMLALATAVAVDVVMRYLPALHALADGASALRQAEATLRGDPAHLDGPRLDRAGALLSRASADFGARSTIVDSGALLEVAGVVPGLRDQIAALRTLRRVGTAATRLGLDAIPMARDLVGGSPAGAVARLASTAVRDRSALDGVSRDLGALAAASAGGPRGPIPGPLGGQLATVRGEVPRLVGMVGPVRDILDALIAAVGSGRHTYLLLLTNPAEERPGGGFIGALGSVTVANGALVSADFRISDFANSRVTDIPAPAPLDRYLFHGHPWELSDANWSPDFPTSARTVRAFYQRATGQTVDGVISVDPVALGLVLRVLGPVRVAPYPQTITAENALREINDIINRARPGDPGKVYLPPLGRTVLDRVFAARPAQLPALAAALADGIRGRHINMLVDDASVQQVVDRYGASGAVPAAGGDDALLIADANLSGSKADLLVSRQFDLVARVDADGTVHDRLTLSYQDAAPENAADRNLVQGSGGDYRDYVRVYLPADAQLDSMVAVEDGQTDAVSPESMTVEDGRLAVAYYLVVPRGAHASLELDYRGPFAHTDGTHLSYRLAWSKQVDALTWQARVTVETQHTRREWTAALDQDRQWSFEE